MTRKGLCVQEQILDIIREGNPLSTSQLAQHLKVSWHTVQHYCFELVFKGKIDKLTVGSSHIWIKKGGFLASASLQKLQEQLSWKNDQNQREEPIQKQLREQILDSPAIKTHLANKLDESLSALIDQEIDRTLQAVQNSLQTSLQNSLEKKSLIKMRKKEETKEKRKEAFP